MDAERLNTARKLSKNACLAASLLPDSFQVIDFDGHDCGWRIFRKKCNPVKPFRWKEYIRENGCTTVRKQFHRGNVEYDVHANGFSVLQSGRPIYMFSELVRKIVVAGV